MTFVDSSGAAMDGQSFSNYAYLDFTTGSQVIQFQATDLPTCIGFQPVVFDLQVTKADGTTAYGLASQAAFNSCVATKSQSCFYIDSTYAFKYYIYDTSYLGVNTISFVPTMSGLDSNSVMNVYTYTLAESTTITLNLIADCLFTTFDQPAQGAVIGMPDIKTNVLNPLPPTIVDIEDSVGTANADSFFCGDRNYAIISTDSNPLSVSLLACTTNCLKLTSVGNTLTISLKVVDKAYLGLTLPFTLQVNLKMYSSIPEVSNPSANYNFNVIVYAHDSCMSTVFQTPKQFNTTTSMLSPLKFRAQVKAYNQLDSHDEYNDVNFPYTRYYVQSTDSVAVTKAVPTFCKGRVFQLTVASNETNYLASQLISNQSQSKIYIAPYDDYTYLIAVRIMEDVYTGKTLSFNLTIWLNQYHSNSTVGEPSSSFNLLLMIDPCVTQSSKLSPLSAQSLDYYINTTMSPLQFTINRVPNCMNPAKYTLQAQTLTDLLQIQNTYGVYVTTSSDGYNAQLLLWVYASSYSLLNTQIELTLYNLDNPTPQSFGIVTLHYLCKVLDATLAPSGETSYTYQIGSVMSSLQYFVTRDSICGNVGDIAITVTINQVEDSNYGNYGIVVSQSQSGQVTQINLASNYNTAELNGIPIDLTLSYQVDGMEFTFATITAMYVNSLIQAKQTEPPFFTTKLAAAEDIPCLDKGSQWLYRLPPTQDPKGYPIRTTISCPNLQKSIKFDSTLNVLTLNTKGVLPAPGGQDCKITLSNPTGAYQSYILNLFVICDTMANGTLWNWTAIVRNKRVEPPIPTMQTTSRYGDLFIYWNKPMIMTNLSGNYSNQIQEAVVRKLADNVIDLVYSQESDPTRIRTQNLNYTYDIFWANDKTTQIAITYQNPQYVSAQTQVKDKIIVTFTKPQFFQSRDGQYINDNITLETTVPKQIAPSSVDLRLNQVVGKQTATIILVIAFVLSLCLTLLLNKLISLVENIIIILHYFILLLDYPANVQDFFAFLFPIVIFDALPVEGLYQDIFDFENVEDAPINDNFAAVGYGNTVLVENMGSFWLITTITITFTLIVTLLRFIPWRSFCCCCGKLFQERIDRFIKNTYWNGVIRFIDTCYLCVMMMAMIALTDLRLDSDHTNAERYNSLLAISVFCILAAFPFVITLIYIVKMKSAVILPDPDDSMQIETIRYLYKSTDFSWIHQNIYTKSQHMQFMQTYGVLLENIDIERLGKYKAIFAAVMPVWHKLLIAIIIMVTLPHPFYAIMAFNQCSIAILVYIYLFNPYTTYHIRRRVIANQFALLIVNYHLYCFTDWQDIDIQIMVGDWVIRFVIIQCILLALAEMAEAYRLFKLSCLKRAHLRRWQKKQKLKKAKTMHIQVQPSIKQVETPEQTATEIPQNKNQKRHIISRSETDLLRRSTLEVSSLNGVNWQANFHEMMGHVDNHLQCIKSEGSAENLDSNRINTFHPQCNLTIVDLTPLPDSCPLQQDFPPPQLNITDRRLVIPDNCDATPKPIENQLMLSESSPISGSYFRKTSTSAFAPKVKQTDQLEDYSIEMIDQLQDL